MLRLDAAAFGAPRAAVIRALQSEGTPCSAGYGFSLHRQPMFRNRAFGPYLPGIGHTLDYSRVHCPNSDRICDDEALWLEHRLLLEPASGVDEIARAFEKIHANRAALSDWHRRHADAGVRGAR
jgi:hypothetical protein